jgi:integrase
LGTGRLTEAKYRARILAGLVQTIFRSMRNGSAKLMLTDSQINQLIQKYIKRLLDDDLRFRLDYPDFQAKGDRLGQELYSDMMEERGKTEHQLVAYDFSEAAKEVATVLAEANIKDTPAGSLEFNKMRQKLLQAKIRYWEIMAERAVGRHLTANAPETPPVFDASETSALIPAHPSTPQVTIGELVAAYWKERIESKKERSKQKYQTIRTRILEFFSENTPVHTIGYYQCKDFRDFIQNYAGKTLAPKTVNYYLDFLRGMFNFEAQTTRAFNHNPAGGVRVEDNRPEEDKRAPFDLYDLELMFVRSPHYFKDRFRKAHQFWLPLLGLYTGARLEELCQLKASDIKKVDGIWVVDINEFDEKKSVKTGERRKVTLHPFLLELGFHRFAESRPEEGQLFDLNYVNNRWSHAYSQQFKKFKDRAGIDSRPNYKVFHSFRKTVATHLKDQMVDEVITAELLGHKH